jgi:hypothetical protein
MAMEIQLTPRQTPGSSISRSTTGWQLYIPSGLPRDFRLAQLDNYPHSPRTRFRHVPPWTFSLRARLSGIDLPGTWGFGLWNDPFGFSLGFGGEPARMPALPQTAWFMHASPPNWLSLQDGPTTGSDQANPASGFFAGTNRSACIPPLLLVPGLLAFPLCAIKPFSRLLRKLASRIIRQDAAMIDVDVTQWHEYSIHWLKSGCTFSVDGDQVLFTTCNPHPPLGMVIWIDNQFAAWNPQGHLAYGTLANSASWLEIEGLAVSL